MSENVSTRAAVDRLVAARDEGPSVAADQALARLESQLFGKRERTVCIDRYPLVRKLGEGGMGLVYLAYDPRLDRKVAIKLLKSSGPVSRADSEGRARLLREAQAMARSPHPNVVAVYDVDTYAGGDAGHAGVYLTMEYVEGPDLRRWLTSETRRWAETLEVFVAAGRGLAAAHAVGVVHRDFKPANVIVGVDGRARVLDFGLALGTDGLELENTLPSIDEAGGLDTPLTVEGSVLGTPAYMAPEQHQGAPADARSDQYAFCVALWEGLYGERPFEGSTLMALEEAKRGEPPKPPAHSDVPGWLEAALLRGMACDPKQRWPAMDALLEALERGAERRRKVWGLAAGLALVLGVGAAAAWGGPRQDEVCTGSSDRVEEVWNASRRDAIERTFLSTDRAYADDAFTRVAARLDGLGSAWAEQHRDACEATNVRAEQSSRLMDLHMACLDRQMRDVDALLDVFETADAAVVERAVRAARALPEPVACANVDALLAEVPPPQDAETAREVERVRNELARARALERAGRVAEGRELTELLAEQASALGYRPVLAEVLTIRGLLEQKAGDYDRATETVVQAHTAALASGHDRVAGKAAQLLVYLIGVRQGDLDEALRWAEVSAAELERGKADDYDHAMLLSSMSNVYRVGGRLEDARRTATEALEVVQRVAPEDPYLATLHTNLGEVLRRLGELDDAQQQHERALALHESSVGPSHPDVAIAHNNLGNVHNGRGDLDAAAREYRAAVEIRERAYGAEHPRVATTLSNLGIILRRQGKLDEAREAYARALAILEVSAGEDSPQLGGALNGLAQVVWERGELEEAASLLERAVRVQETGLGPDHFDLNYALRNLGEVYRDMERYADSIAAYERAEAILARSPGEQAVALGDTRYQFALTLRAAGRERAALTKVEQALGELPEGADESLEKDLRGMLADPP